MSQQKSKIIKYKPPGSFEETRFEKLHNIIYNNSDEGSLSIAHSMAELIKKKQSQKKKMQFLCVQPRGQFVQWRSWRFPALLVLY